MSELVTDGENRIITYLKQGYPNIQIADKLCLSESTVKFHLTNIFKKYEVKSRSEFLSLMNGHSKQEKELIMETYKKKDNLPVSQEQRHVTQQDKIKFIDQQFKVGDTVQHLHSMMTEVTKDEVNPATVNAACNCVARLNETINTAIQAARFLNER